VVTPVVKEARKVATRRGTLLDDGEACASSALLVLMVPDGMLQRMESKLNQL
jgi:hypothetical protein